MFIPLKICINRYWPIPIHQTPPDRWEHVDFHRSHGSEGHHPHFRWLPPIFAPQNIRFVLVSSTTLLRFGKGMVPIRAKGWNSEADPDSLTDLSAALIFALGWLQRSEWNRDFTWRPRSNKWSESNLWCRWAMTCNTTWVGDTVFHQFLSNKLGWFQKSSKNSYSYKWYEMTM